MKHIQIFSLFLFFSAFASFSNAQNHQSIKDYIASQAQEGKIPNSVVLWVGEGEILLGHIFDNENIAEVDILDTSKSLLRMASISKPFTAMTALSLANSGVLNVNASVNELLSGSLLENQFNPDIRVKHLLTHTAGLDDFYINKSVRDISDVETLANNLANLKPRQVMPPGEISSYSNYGVALLGYLLEHRSGLSFENLVKERLFMPADMSSSAFEITEHNQKKILKGWHKSGNNLQVVPLDFIKDVPAGHMFSTVDDVLRFMQIITSKDEALDTLQLMIKALFKESSKLQFTHHPALTGGLGYLWSINQYAGHQVVAHDGGYAGVATRMMYFPEHNQIMFIFCNMMDFNFVTQITDSLVEEFLPEANSKVIPYNREVEFIADNRQLQNYSGTYRNTRYSRYSMLKLASLLGAFGVGGELTVTHDYQFLLMPDHLGKQRRLKQIDSLLFESIDDDYLLAFRSENGKITHAFTSGSIAMEKLRFYEKASFQFVIMVLSILIFILLMLVIPIQYLLAGKKTKDGQLSRNKKLVSSISGLYILQLVFLFIGGMSVETYELMIGFAYGVPRLFYLANLLPLIAIIATVYLSIRVVPRASLSSPFILTAVFIVVALIYFLCLLYWNMVGWKF
jgi:CubicO group peptidase (beta-lactamase class C family)